jgi:hypothetical protein
MVVGRLSTCNHQDEEPALAAVWNYLFNPLKTSSYGSLPPLAVTFKQQQIPAVAVQL